MLAVGWMWSNKFLAKIIIHKCIHVGLVPYHCLCILVPTDLTLTTDRLVELFQSVEEPPHLQASQLVFGRSHDFGKDLGLPKSALEEIERSYHSWAKCKGAYLDTYIHHHPCPSWKRISELLERYSLRQQASEVKGTYVQGMHETKSS